MAIIFKCPDEQATQLLLGRPCHRRFTQSIHAKAPARQRFLRSVPVLVCFETGSEGFFLWHGSKCKTRRVDQICVPSKFLGYPYFYRCVYGSSRTLNLVPAQVRASECHWSRVITNMVCHRCWKWQGVQFSIGFFVDLLGRSNLSPVRWVCVWGIPQILL